MGRGANRHPDGRCKRGTTNRNQRGSSAQRRRRRNAIAERDGVGGVVLCWLCGVPVLVWEREGDPESRAEVFEQDRVVPGSAGGRYEVSNLRPACGPCNRERGNAHRDGLPI